MNAMKLAIPLFVALAYGPSQGLAVPILGPDLATFAVLGESTVTNVPTSTIVGNVGVSAGSSITGFASSPGVAVSDPQVTGGKVHTTTTFGGVGTPNAADAQLQLTTARATLTSLGPGTLLPADLVGLTIFPGLFTVPAGITNLSGTVTLNGLGSANAFWRFQFPSTFITSPGSSVIVINTGPGAGVFFNVGSSATLDTTTSLEGNILALTAISVKTGAKITCGRALADNAAVTLDKDTVSIGCAGTGEAGSGGLSGSGLEFIGRNVVIAAGQPGAGTVVSVPGAFVPEPGTLALFGFGLAGLFAFRKRLFPVA